MMKSLWTTFSRYFVLDFENVGHWPIHIKVLVCILLFGFGVVLGTVVWIKPKTQRVYFLQEQATDTNEKLLLAMSLVETYPSLAKHKEELSVAINEKMKILENSAHSALVAAQLDAASHIANVSIGKFSWKAGIQHQNKVANKYMLIEKPFELTLLGSYHQIARFIELVSDFDTYLIVQHFTLQLVNRELRLSLKGVIYESPV